MRETLPASKVTGAWCQAPALFDSVAQRAKLAACSFISWETHLATRGRYKIWVNGKFVYRARPAAYAGVRTMKIFGRLDCGSGRRALTKNRVFFRSYEDAVAAGYRPCRNCHPVPGLTWQESAEKLGEDYRCRHART